MSEEIFDLRGLKCPLPALLTRKRLQSALPGETLIVVADDPMAGVDIPHMCGEEGYDVLAVERGENEIRLRLTKSA